MVLQNLHKVVHIISNLQQKLQAKIVKHVNMENAQNRIYINEDGITQNKL